MIKKLLLLSLFFSNFTFCLQNPDKEDPKLREIRQALTKTNNPDDVVALDPSIIIAKRLSKTDRYGVCHDYALSKVLGIEGQLSDYFAITGNHDWYKNLNILDDYFEETMTPEKGDLVLYGTEKNLWFIKQRIWQHTGIVHDTDLVESKWEERPAVFVHPTFLTPHIYKDRVRYYRQIEPNDEIIRDLQRKISSSSSFSRECRLINQELFDIAASGHNSERIDTLMNWYLCADANTSNLNKQTPLFSAAKVGHKGAIRKLLEYGANVNQKDCNGHTALDMAKDKETIDLLVENGIVINTENNKRQTPLHNAAKTGNREAIEKLIVLGLDVNKQDQYGNTPLHLAAYFNKREAVMMLIQNGANLSNKNNAGDTFKDCVFYNTIVGRTRLLSREYGTKIDDETRRAIHKFNFRTEPTKQYQKYI